MSNDWSGQGQQSQFQDGMGGGNSNQFFESGQQEQMMFMDYSNYSNISTPRNRPGFYILDTPNSDQRTRSTYNTNTNNHQPQHS